MPTEVILPKVDMDMATGTMATWHVEDGATVKKGQAIFDIETDKAAMEIEAPADGVIKLGNAKKGDVLPIGAVVAMIYAAGETPRVFSQDPSPSSVTPAKAGAPLETKAEVHPQEKPSKSDGIRATPLARRLARQKGVKLEAITGSGPRGRIVAEDVTEAKPIATHAAPTAIAAGPDAQAVRAMYAEGSYDVKPLDGMRRIIAQRLTQSKQTVPHFYLSATCTIHQLLAIRERLNARSPKDGAGAYKLSINDFIIKAMALALQQVPDANVTFTDDGILQHRASDVGVAVSVEGGLFTPIIRNAEKKTLAAISSEMKELAARARAKKLQPAEYQGGSAAISNLGMFGVESFTAIINPPQATILAVGSAVERFVPVNKQPVLATQMSVTLSCDHRAVDGAVGAKLLQVFKSLIEDPALMLV
ncbi:MAG: dihydrolipoamide acetyltransferase family protein [Aestuariivirga sp.]